MEKLKSWIVNLGIYSVLLGCLVPSTSANSYSISDRVKTATLASSPDPALEKSLLETRNLTCSQVDQHNKYNYIRVNLNNDQKAEVIAIASGTKFSGTGGASTYIFEAQGSNYRLVSKIGLSRWNPLLITERFTNGWRNLVMYAEEVHNSDNYYPFLLKFNGTDYPSAVHQGIRLSPSAEVSGLKVQGDPKNAFKFCSNSNTQNTDFVRLYADDPNSRIRLRSRPSTNAPDKGYGLVGDRVKVLETTKGQHGYTWYKVRFPKSGAIGWIRGDLIRR